METCIRFIKDLGIVAGISTVVAYMWHKFVTKRKIRAHVIDIIVRLKRGVNIELCEELYLQLDRYYPHILFLPKDYYAPMPAELENLRKKL